MSTTVEWPFTIDEIKAMYAERKIKPEAKFWYTEFLNPRANGTIGAACPIGMYSHVKGEISAANFDDDAAFAEVLSKISGKEITEPMVANFACGFDGLSMNNEECEGHYDLGREFRKALISTS